jgi:hypothetical protein
LELAYILNQAENQAIKSRWTATTVFEEAQDNFFPMLQFLIDLMELRHGNTSHQDDHGDFHASFETNFRLGPYGLHPIINFLQRLYNLVLAQRHYATSGFVLQIETLNVYTTPLHALLLHFRTSVNRVEYDPTPFSELRQELQTGSHKFPVCCYIVSGQCTSYIILPFSRRQTPRTSSASPSFVSAFTI